MSRKPALKNRVMELYRTNQILWNPHCSGYRNHLFRQKAWEKCANQLQMPTEQFKRMTTSLRSYYNRIRKSPNFAADASPEWVRLADSFLSQLGDHVVEPFDEEQFVRQEIQTESDESGAPFEFEFEPLNFPASKRRMTEKIAHRLMLLYKELPVLWQPDHPHYNVVFHRNQAWQRISECVNVAGLTPGECKKEVHQIRSRYVIKRKSMTDSDIVNHNVDWFQLAHSFLDTVLFERDASGDLVLVNVRQGQKKYKPNNDVATKSVFLNEPEAEEEILKCRVCLTRLKANDRPNFAEDDPIFALYTELVGFSPLAAGPDRICSTCEAKVVEYCQFRSQCRENEEALITTSAQETVETVHFLEIETLETDYVEPTVVEERMDDPTRIICELCTKDFVSQYNLNTHLRNIHGIERIEVNEDDTPLPKETANICPKCGKQVTSLSSHMKTHKPPNAHRCQSCDKSYKTQRNLRVHQRSAHEDFALTCSHCPAKFRSWSGRQDHYLVKHSTASAQFQCTFCNRFFSAARVLNRHIRQLHSSRTHKCDQCEAVFTRSTNLRAHVDAKHVGKVELVSCELCVKQFANKKLLQQHLISHTGVKNYPCPVCEAKFGRSHVLRRHIQQLHKGYQLPPKGTVTSVRALQRMAQQLS